MLIILLIIILIVIIVRSQLQSDKKKTKFLNNLYPGRKILQSDNYFILLGDNIILAHKVATKKQKYHIEINKIKEIKIYEDGKEASAGKALVGGITFGLIGAIIGSSMKTEYVNKMGIKLYTDKGCQDLMFLSQKTKRDSMLYQLSNQTLDAVYAKLIEYQE